MLRLMCEQFVARGAAEPFRLDELWPYAERVDCYGIAGFGWGAAWLRPDGGLETVPRHPGAVPGRPGRGSTRRRSRPRASSSTSCRPSRLSTLPGMPDAQPFEDPARAVRLLA